MKLNNFFISSMVAGSALIFVGCASTTPSPDAALSAQVKREIAQTEGIGSARSVNVEAHRGVVLLSGFIDNEKQKYDAAQAALKVNGVQQVFNNIQVQNPTSSGR